MITDTLLQHIRDNIKCHITKSKQDITENDFKSNYVFSVTHILVERTFNSIKNNDVEFLLLPHSMFNDILSSLDIAAYENKVKSKWKLLCNYIDDGYTISTDKYNNITNIRYDGYHIIFWYDHRWETSVTCNEFLEIEYKCAITPEPTPIIKIIF